MPPTKYLTASLIIAILFSLTLSPATVQAGQMMPLQAALAQSSCDAPANEIVAENCLPGNPSSEWDISGDGDDNIQGFATDISVDQGETIEFKVDTPASDYRLDIYRMGYYGGDGARLVDTIQPSATLPQSQPSCLTDSTTGLIDCGNWGVSASWAVPADATSGIYFAKLVREDGTPGSSHIVFIVRDDDGESDILFQTADTTWQAYNSYGGNSLYVGSPAGRAYKVSYNRPFNTRQQANEDWVFNAEYPMVRWLERNGYDVSYFTGVDTDRFGTELLEHDLYLSVGHDEYWSAQQRTHVENARDAGVHLAFFSGNEVFWKTRWEPSIDGTNTDYRTLVSYKETHAGAKIDPLPDVWTGTWRDARPFNPEGPQPENALTGQIFTVNAGTDLPLRVPAEDGQLRFWRNTAAATLAPGDALELGDDIIGYEWDEPLDNGARPAGLFHLSTYNANVSSYLQDYGSSYSPGAATHHLSLYRHSSGALVFGAGTVQWSWGLDSNHDRGNAPAEVDMQQATVNLFADMGVQPATLQAELEPATQSTDSTPPTSTIDSPANGASVQGLITISGSASDAEGRVGGVEVSVDGGATWHPAEGRESWSYTWNAAELGSVNLLSRAVDDSANLETAGAGINVTVEPRTCPCSIWEGTGTPANANEIDGQPIEVGVRFQTDIDGYITSLRYYKGDQHTGTHVGHLWDSAGNLLAEATYANETASGWQEVTLDTPVAVVANTTYIASYHSSSGHYAVTDGGLATEVANPPVRALANSVESNGVYKYGAAGFPTETFGASNYWVDVVFTANVGPDTPPPNEGPGGPILVIADASNPFTRYYAEILRAEGLNAFTVSDISLIDAATLDSYEVVIVGEMPLSSAQATLLSDWVNAGGNLIAMRPDADLAGLLGLSAPSGTLADGYLLVDTSDAPGAGIVGETIQFHGSADLYTNQSATVVATLYSNATTATPNPAVTVRSVGANGGQAAAFTFDLARSVVLTRQGNPAWAGQNRDGQSGPTRPNDMFFGAASFDPQTDWVNLSKVAIPQADEAQRLLANLIGYMNADETPLPRFWYFPRGEKAVLVMTHDDHGSGSTVERINNYNSLSPAGCSVEDWECVTSSTYLYAPSQISDAQIAAFQAQGHEFVVHVNTGCSDFTLESLRDDYTNQLADFASTYPSADTPLTQRTHCIAFSDWASQPTVQLENGIRMDTNYYYWPGSWIQDRPGMFTGSGIPMRFADVDGTIIDVYQATTQMTDESGQSFPFNIDMLLNRALGTEGYYGAFVANMHTDGGSSADTDALAMVNAAQTRNVPVISAAQLLTWVDGRNASSFANLDFDGSALTFDVNAHSAANGLMGLVPAQNQGATLVSLTRGGTPVPFTVETIKGVSYAQFAATSGSYIATYDADTTAPTINSVTPADGATDVAINSAVTAAFNEPMDAQTLNATTFEVRDESNALVAGVVSYDAGTNTATFTPNAPFATNTQYSARLVGGQVTDIAGNALAADHTWSFTTNDAAFACPCSIWDDATIPGVGAFDDATDYDLGVKFQSSVAGYITGIRFYRGATDAGPFVGKLWANDGTLLASTDPHNLTQTGWQEVLFDTPVQIDANTTYIASYYTPSGDYALTADYFASAGIDNPPLRALQSGEDGPNAVFREGGGFPNQNVGTPNYWVDVVFQMTLASDTTPPVISNVAASAGSGTSATVTWVTDEAATSRVDYGTDPNTLDQTLSDATLATAHSVALSGLTPNTTYYYRVTSADGAGNSASAPDGAPASFTTPDAPDASLSDTTAADFGAGTLDSLCYVAEMADGELLLAPTVGSEFAGTTLPTGWESVPWEAGGSATVASGSLSVDRARVATESSYGPGRSIEFVATFGSQQFQHVGFGQLLADVNGEYWAMFSTHNTGSGIYARTNNNGAVINTLLPGIARGETHRYRIEWSASEVRFYVDGALVDTHAVAITAQMRPVASDLQGSVNLSVDWLRMSPYQSPCSFTSRVLDGGDTMDWQALTWNGDQPTGTSVSFETRSGNSASVDGSWSDWQAVGGNGEIASPNSRYIQYRATLANTDAGFTPVVADVTITANAVTLATLNGTLTLQGRGDHAASAGDVTVALYAVGDATTPVATFTPQVASDGSFSINDITPGEYQVAVKHVRFLQRVQTLTLVEGSNAADFGQQLAGDANNNNTVEFFDFSILVSTFEVAQGDPGYSASADFNGDGAVNFFDFSILVSNFDTAGESPTSD